MNNFEKITKYNSVDFNLPCRKTINAAGYDFEVVEDVVIPSIQRMWYKLIDNADISHLQDLESMSAITKMSTAKPTLVPTGVKCQLDPDCYLELSVRSSTPLKYWIVLANGVGIIDADYYNNSDNEGHIFFQVINLSPFDILLKKGDIIGQGIIKRYEKIDNDISTKTREGGFGSTTKQNQSSAHGLRVNTAIVDDPIAEINQRHLGSMVIKA